jgi:hypothetical protein
MTPQPQPPIYRISVEILCSIFSFSRSKLQPHLSSFDIHRQNLSILRLTAVCHHWRSVAIDYAMLWNNIAFSTSALPTIDCATTFLGRSKGTSLYVHIWDMPKPGHLRKSPHNTLSHLLSLISLQRNRIVLLEVIDPSAHLLDAFQWPAEKVSQLIVQGRTPMTRSDLFSVKLPNVQQITLISPTPCRLGSLARLTQVTLHSGPRRWNIDAFLDCVDGCASLQSLSITRYLGFHPGKNPTRIISLPSLANLRLDTCDSATILGHLNLPPTASVSICINVGYVSDNFVNIFSCMPSEINRVNFLRSARSLTVVFNNAHGDFHVSGFNGTTLVFLLQVFSPLTRLDDDWVHRSFAAATVLLPFSEITSLTLVAESAHVPWEPWLRQSNHLSALDVRCPDLGGLAAALNRMQNDTPLCRTLRSLSIDIPHDSWARYASLLKIAIHFRKTRRSALSYLVMNAGEWGWIRQSDPTWMELVRREGLWLNVLGPGMISSRIHVILQLKKVTL